MIKVNKKLLMIGMASIFISMLVLMLKSHNQVNDLQESDKTHIGVKREIEKNNTTHQFNDKMTLSQSDDYSKKTIEIIANGMDLTPYLVEENLIRKFVIFISHLAQGNLHYPTLPTQRPPESLKVKTIGSELYIDDENFYRYKLYTLALSQINAEQIASTYKLMTPLLNEAFQELGADGISFHQTFLKALNVIIHLPTAHSEYPIQKVNQQYRFKNAELESLLPIQKLMMRMGPENAILIQKKAQAILQALEPEHTE